MSVSRRQGIYAVAIAVAAMFAIGTSLLFQFAPAADAQGVARVRVLHAGADAPAVNVLVNGQTAVKSLSFGHITGYLPLNPRSTYDIRIVPASAPGKVVFELKNARFPAGDTTVAAIGLLNPGTTGNCFTLKAYRDDNSVAFGRARVRVVHVSPNAPAVDIYAKHQGTAAKVVAGLTYPNATGYLAVQPGFYAFAIAPSPSNRVSQAIFTTPRVFLRPNSTYTAWALGTLGNNFTVLLTPDAGLATFRGGDESEHE